MKETGKNFAKKAPIAFIATMHNLRDPSVRPMHLVQDKTYKIGES